MKPRRGMAPLIVVVFLAVTVTLFFMLEEKIPVDFERAVEFIDKEVYPINRNLHLVQIQASGIKVTSTSVRAFVQECRRIRADVGAVSIGVDFELRVLFAFDPTQQPLQREFYYLKFDG